MESIFLLEDDQTLGRGIVMALEAPGHTVTLAGSLREGRAVLAGECFDLLILDINLPDGSGLELLRQLRAAGDRTADGQRLGIGRGHRVGSRCFTEIKRPTAQSTLATSLPFQEIPCHMR